LIVTESTSRNLLVADRVAFALRECYAGTCVAFVDSILQFDICAEPARPTLASLALPCTLPRK
jgi:hypothetical protein